MYISRTTFLFWSKVAYESLQTSRSELESPIAMEQDSKYPVLRLSKETNKPTSSAAPKGTSADVEGYNPDQLNLKVDG